MAQSNECFTPIDEWRRRALDMRGKTLRRGHYIPEKAPEAMLRAALSIPGGVPMKPFRIAVIPGDGIGKEVVPEGLRSPGEGRRPVRSRSDVR